MLQFKLAAAALGLAAIAAPVAASAQPHAPVNARQARIEQRIDHGLRTGALTRGEAFRLRGELRGIERLEYRYRTGGLSGFERRDLERRLDAVSRQVRFERHDRQRRWG